MTTSGQSIPSPRKNLADLGIELPEVAVPVASYAPAVISGDMIYVSGQLPFKNGELPATGKVGAGVSAEDATSYARQAALNALAAINSLVDIDSVSIVKVTGFVA
ncbi:MAG: RidA family protein, partial [Corynebacterium kroppenstedtii]|nr:RidA family protein [Corynebacterium kroppenstedtii]